MADTDVSPQDVQDAATFMQQFLLAKIPDGDFTEGSALYDHVVKGFAYTFAYLRKQVGIVRARQSLLTLNTLPPEESVEDATDALLANLVLSRAQGERARGPAVVYLSARTDLLVPVTARFFKTPANAYLLDATEDLFIPSTSMRPVTSADGRIVAWASPVLNVIAARVGKDFNQPAGPFSGFTRFHPYVLRVEAVGSLEGGDNVQTPENAIRDAGNGLALRALINASSNAAVLQRKFNVEQVISVLAGMPEMTRDRVVQANAGLALHVGGHMDIYIRRPTQQTTSRNQVGGLFTRPDNKAVRLSVPVLSGINFVTGAGIVAPVLVGDVLTIAAGLPEAPFQFKIVGVEERALIVSSRLPFSNASDELSTAEAITFSVGNNYPLFNNKVAAYTDSNTKTEKRTAVDNSILLGGVPVYAIKRIEIIDSVSSALAPYKDPVTDTLVFTQRLNSPAVAAPAPGDGLPFTVTALDAGEAQSGMGGFLIQLGWPGVNLNGLTAEVVYDTVSGFSAVDAYVRSDSERPGCASTLVKGLHPIYVSFTVPYRVVPQRTVLGVLPVAPGLSADKETTIALGLISYLMAYRGVGGLDQSVLAAHARLLAGVELSVYPFTIQYDLLAPDGKVYKFQTNDVLTLAPDEESSVLLNAVEVGLPATGYAAALARRLNDLGVSDRVTRFLVTPGSVTLLRRD